MADAVQTMQSHIATLHNDMGALWKRLQDRNERINVLKQEKKQLIAQHEALLAERDALCQKRSKLAAHVDLVKADHDTLATILFPLLDNHEVDVELNAARLIAVLLLATDDIRQAWKLIRHATHYADHVERLARYVLQLLQHELEHPPPEPLRDYASGNGERDEFTTLADRLSDPRVRAELQRIRDELFAQEQWQPASASPIADQPLSGYTSYQYHTNGKTNGKHLVLD
jgi:hypothetical protein